MINQQQQSTGRGGARPGAGRKPTAPNRVMVNLDDADLAWVDAQPGSRSEVIRRLVQQQRPRKQPRKSRKPRKPRKPRK